MRRVTLILLGATLGLIALSPAAFSAESSRGVDSRASQELEPPEPVGEASGPVSQGSVFEGPGLPEETFEPYTQVVDNRSRNFDASGWKRGSSLSGHYGGDYAVAGSSKSEAARYEVSVPATDEYSVYVWAPSHRTNTSAARVGVATSSGTEWVDVDQKTAGGFWRKVGEFDMRKGESYAIEIAPGARGRTVADAVAVVRGVLSAPPEEGAFRASGGKSTGKDVVRKARRHLGIKYRWGTCDRAQMSCTCLTKKAFRPFGHKLSLSESKQWRYARKKGKVITSRSAVKPGDLLFFKENGRSGPITHVGVASSNGWLVHSSAYFGKVVEKETKYVNGFYRGVRLRLR